MPQLWEKLQLQLTIAHKTQICGKPGFVNPCAQGNTYSYPEEGARFLPAAFPLKGPGWVSAGPACTMAASSHSLRPKYLRPGRT